MNSHHQPGQVEPVETHHDSGRVELEHNPLLNRATVKQLLDEPETSAAIFVARWGKGALLQLPEAELVERALMQFGATATVPSQRGRGNANQALVMLRSFRDMEIDFLAGRGGRALLGRANNAHLRMEHGSVSKLHASIRWNERGTFLEDLRSLNGTLVNGRPVAQLTSLRDGDLIRLGDAYLVFVTSATLFLQLESVRHSSFGGH